MQWSRWALASVSLASLSFLHCFGSDPAFVPPSPSQAADGSVETVDAPPVPPGKTLWARAWPHSFNVDVAVDAVGNTFVAGAQTDAEPVATLVTPKVGYDICFGPDGSARWRKQIPGYYLKIATDPSGAFIYISGKTVEAGPPAAFRLDAATAPVGSIFVAKLDASTGTGVWANSIAQEQEVATLVHRITTNGREVVVSGQFAAKSLTTSGGVGLTTSPERGYDGFLVGFSAENGQGKWASRVGGSGDGTDLAAPTDGLYSVQPTADGEHFLIAGGMVGDPVTATTGGAALSRIGTNYNAFVGSFAAADGTVEWSRLYGGTGKAVGASAAPSRTGDVTYLGGWISGQVNLGTDVAGGDAEGYVLALDTSNRSTRWSKLLDGVGIVSSVRTDDAGDLIAQGTISKRGFSLEGMAVEGAAADTTTGAFVAKWSSSGELRWLKGYGGSGDTLIAVQDMVVTPSGEVRIVGMTDGAFIMNPDEETPLFATKGSTFVIALAP